MSSKIYRETLVDQIKNIETALAHAKAALNNFDSLPENNTFDDLQTAVRKVHGKLSAEARKDCEGSYNFGSDEYTQLFVVNNITYLGKLKVEYNRHDKTYYYVECEDFSFEEVNDSTQ
jgi:hypothetical protein